MGDGHRIEAMTGPWFAETRSREILGRARLREHRSTTRLYVLGVPVHILDGPHGERVLVEQAERWNRERFIPEVLTRGRCAGDLGRRARESAMRGERRY